MTPALKPWLSITPPIMAKAALSIALMSSGMFYLATGRRDADLSRMTAGAVLALASVFLLVL